MSKIQKLDRHFDIDASIVFQLGEGLISDSVQALVELIKNCWDADAEYAKITVDTKGTPPLEDAYFSAPGYILIEDNGSGMNEDAIVNGWLLISNSAKRELKLARGVTAIKKRTPLGEKGLGRLGVQRLGDNVEIFTEQSGSTDGFHVGWSWKEFLGKKRLSELEPRWQEVPARKRKGTKILITGLRDAETWENEQSYERFRMRLAQMVSPYAKFPEFRIIGRINNRELAFEDIADQVRQLANLRYNLDFDGEKLSIAGRMRLDYLRPQSRASEEDIRDYELLVEEDAGEALFEFLLSKPAASRFRLARMKARAWFCSYSTDASLSEIDKVELGGNGAASPGPFHAEVDSYNLDPNESVAPSVFDRRAEYRKYVETYSGVRVYRDGFGVRVDGDWIGLATAWTRGGSYYGLRPANVMGFVSLTAKDNQALVEATDREGFIDTPAHRNFVLLFRRFAKFAADAQEFVRRGYVEFRGHNARKRADVRPEAGPAEVTQSIISDGEQIAAIRSEVRSVSKDVISPAIDKAAQLRKLTTTATSLERKFEASSDAVTALTRAVQTAGDKLKAVEQRLSDVDQIAQRGKVLQGQIQVLLLQLQEAYLTVSLGLTAEALSHEIGNVVDRLNDRTTDISKYLQRSRTTDQHVQLFVEEVKALIKGLRKQLAHLAPSLKYARERKQVFQLSSFAEELAEYHRSRWTDVAIDLQTSGVDADFQVKISRGKLTQVLDNLILNSDYWLRESLRKRVIHRGVMTLKGTAPYLRLSDNGPGIDPSIEGSLFSPFTSTRTNGRGLGLFITRQLLDSEGCSIGMTPRRNTSGRLYQFEINFSGAMNDGTK